MADVLSKEQRSKNMKAIKSISKLEIEVCRALWRSGLRFRRNSKLFGKPDISIKKYKIVVFIDSCFWHVCPEHGRIPTSNQDFWLKKLTRNQERDNEVNAFYLNNNWNLLRIWEHELKSDFDGTIQKIIDFIGTAKER